VGAGTCAPVVWNISPKELIVSDHFSGPRAIAGPAADICDFYAFPSPNRPGNLTLVMTVRPMATAESFFSEAIEYRFRLRPLTVEQHRRGFKFGPEASELVFACRFATPTAESGAGASVQEGWCTGPNGEITRLRTGDEGGGGGDRLRVFAGVRSDPFFIDLPALFESIELGRVAFKPEGRNSLHGMNVLALVVEVDGEQLLQGGRGPLWAMVGETVVSGKLPIRIERVGRPEIKNVLMAFKDFDQVNHDLEVRDLYNLEDAFHMSKDYRGVYRARLNANLAVFDRLDGKIDWPLGKDGSHPLTELLLADYLVLDVSKPFTEKAYFEIEHAILEGRSHWTCGGRSLNEDVMDTIYTLVVNGGKGPRISEGLGGATAPASNVFPYLAPANPPPTPEQLALVAALTGKEEPHEHHDHHESTEETV
jgi:Domain of unknown function (DUF4331)